MDSKLHAMTYIRNNRWRVAILIICLSLFIGTQYGVAYFLYSNASVSYAAGADIFKQAAIVYVNPEFLGFDSTKYLDNNVSLTEEERANFEASMYQFAEELLQNEHLKAVYPCTLCNSTIRLVFGQWKFVGPLLEKQELDDYLSDMGATLVSGKMPELPGDILLDKKLAANMEAKIGDVLGGVFTVTGIVENDIYMLTGIASDSIKTSMLKNSLWLITDGTIEDATEFLAQEEFSEDDITVRSDYASEMKVMEEEMVKSIDTSMAVITMVLAFVLCFCVLVVFTLHIRDRHEEWCLYQSIGFSAKSIYFLALRELLLCFTIAIVIGIIIAGGILTIGELAIMIPKGLCTELFLPKTIIMIGCLLLFIFGLLQVPIIHAISSTKTVDAIEDDIY